MTHHARKLVRTLLPVGAAAAMLVLGGTVTPAYADSTPSCTSGVFSGAGDGPLTKKLQLKASAFSASAKEKIEKAGGTAEVVGGRSEAAAG